MSVSQPGRHARMASAVTLAGREAAGAAGMDRGAFATYLGIVTGREVSPEDLEFWEVGGSMPGDVLLVCAGVIREVLADRPGFAVAAQVRELALRLAADVPPLPSDDPIRAMLDRQQD